MLRLKSIRVTDPEWQGITSKKTVTKLTQVKQMLKDGKVVMTKWCPDSNALLLAFSTGAIVTLFLKYASFQIDYIYIDKYLCHKITTGSSSNNSHMTDMVYREDEVILMSFAEPKIIAAFVTKNGSGHKSGNSVKLKHKDLKIMEIELDNRYTSSNSRQSVHRHLLMSEEGGGSSQMFAIWWQSSSSLSPWSAPMRRDANILIYLIEKSNIKVISHSLIPDQIKRITFSTAHKNRLLILTSVSELSMHFAVVEVVGKKEVRELSTVFSVHVPLQTPVLQTDYTAAQDKLIILCQDRNCVVYDLNQNSAITLTTSIDATQIMSSPLDSLFVICDKYGQLLMYDCAMSVIPANYDDVCYKANLDFMDSISSVSFLNDHLICLRYTVTEDASSEITIIGLPAGVDVPTLVREYLHHDYVSEAINILVSTSWNFDPYLCYTCLTIIFNFLMKSPLNPLRESLLESTLAAYFRPKYELDHETVTQYGGCMNLLAKRFFFHLIRFNSLDKAFLLAVDIRSKHLFHLLLRISLEHGNGELAHRCSVKLEQIIGRERDRSQRKERRHRRVSAEDSFASHSDDSNRIRHQVSSAILVVDGQDGDESDSAPRDRQHRLPRPPIPAPRSPGAGTRTTTFAEPVPTFRETVNIIRHVGIHPDHDEYGGHGSQAVAGNFSTDPYVHLIPPSLPPKRAAAVTIRTNRTSTPSTSQVRSPDLDALLQYSPPPVPPKTFLQQPPLHQHQHHNDGQSVAPPVAAVNESVYATTKVVPFTGQSVVRSAAVRSTVSNNRHAGTNSSDETENAKPRFECINFGLV